MKKILSQLALVVVVAAGVCVAQTSNQGAIVGSVKDPNGLVVPSVTITITNIATGVSRNTVSDSEGNYRFDFLQPGTYRILAEANGFRRSEIPATTVNVSQVHREDFKLEVGSVSEEVVVTDDPPPGDLDHL